MIVKTRQIITRNLLNIPGWRTKRKIVVIESDDWGSIRMASKEAYNYFLKLGYPVDECTYNRFDSLESNDDLELLFNVLSSVKDKNGNPAIITANSLVANPDFERIKNDNFSTYYFEPFTETLKKYPYHDRVYSLYQQGINEKVIKPQFHGREHLNVHRWMEALQNGDESAIEAFNQNMFSVHAQRQPENKLEYMEALDCDTPDQLLTMPAIISEGLDLFHSLWGFGSKSFIASCYIWRPEIERVLFESGIRYIQGTVNQVAPVMGSKYKYKRIYHYLGQQNKFGQKYLLRNAYFEPSHTPDTDNVGECLRRVSIAFNWSKPAIISTHRLNFTGSLVPENRDRGLYLLRELLKNIVRQWPDVEFMTSDELGDLMSVDEKNK
jgi:hypothetical protein